MQPQVSAILKRMKESGNRISLDSFAKMYGLHVGEPKFIQLLRSFTFQARKNFLRVEDNYLVLDEDMLNMKADELIEYTEEINKEINKISKDTRDFRLLVIVLVALVSFTLGFLISQRFMACDIFLDEETLTNIKCPVCVE